MLNDTKIPASVITGFLGAGKTTVIQNILQNANGRRIALIINEFGDVGIDGEVLKGCGQETCKEDDIVELTNGCICCTVADDFIPAMTKLLEREDPPHHIVIETSGLALPQPLVRAFNWPEIKSRVTVDGVITVVDSAAISEGQYASDEKAVQSQREADDALDHESPLEELFEDQLICADMVLLNKTDLLDNGALDTIEQQLKSDVRPGVRFIRTKQGEISSEILLGLKSNAEANMEDRKSHHEHFHNSEEHDHDDFQSFSIGLGAIDNHDEFLNRIHNAIADYPILRLKGFAAVQNKDMRLVVQAVGPRLTTYYGRPWQPGEKRESTIIVIGEAGLDEHQIRSILTG